MILHHNAIVVEFEEGHVNDDISFMTSLKSVGVWNMPEGTLTLPSSVVDLDLQGRSRGATVLGTENLTGLISYYCGVSFTPCPNLRELGLNCRRISENIPFAWAQSTALTSMMVTAGCVEPGFQFPPNLVRMELTVESPFFDDATFTPLTPLESIDLYIVARTNGLTFRHWCL